MPGAWLARGECNAGPGLITRVACAVSSPEPTAEACRPWCRALRDLKSPSTLNNRKLGDCAVAIDGIAISSGAALHRDGSDVRFSERSRDM